MLPVLLARRTLSFAYLGRPVLECGREVQTLRRRTCRAETIVTWLSSRTWKSLKKGSEKMAISDSFVIEVAARFCGPPGSANGGYICSLVTDHIHEPVTVRLLRSAPLGHSARIARCCAGPVGRRLHGIALHRGTCHVAAGTGDSGVTRIPGSAGVLAAGPP